MCLSRSNTWIHHSSLPSTATPASPSVSVYTISSSHTSTRWFSMQSTPAGGFNVYPRAPLSVVPPSLLTYQMLASHPPREPAPQYPLLHSSLFLPIHHNRSPVYSPHSPKAGEDGSKSHLAFYTPPRLEAETLGSIKNSPASSPQLDSPPPTHASLTVTAIIDTEDGRSQAHFEKNEVVRDPVHENNDKKDLPLDLTMKRRSESGGRTVTTSEVTKEDERAHLDDKGSFSEKPEHTKFDDVIKPRPRQDHPFLRISDLLKDSPSSSPVPNPPYPPAEPPAKLPLVYPRPLHPAAILDMYRSLDRSAFMAGSCLPSARYPLFTSLFPHASLPSVSMAPARTVGLDFFKSHMPGASRPYGDLVRPYSDLLTPHMDVSRVEGDSEGEVTVDITRVATSHSLDGCDSEASVTDAHHHSTHPAGADEPAKKRDCYGDVSSLPKVANGRQQETSPTLYSSQVVYHTKDILASHTQDEVIILDAGQSLTCVRQQHLTQ
ncbi:putative MDS1 and EVI1 complex locus protein EVI1-like [Homarus americanus]|uniref:Putative MDS1 and EVI1 complex locus protein EVI1-like n=1 Tax=Homarus americanus TaxID=6706 RepID=A0A8J5N136_HOMAM|nr:putative MDS1 and EVI1 complex locus protein EVI1-like [Homarus americanus]